MSRHSLLKFPLFIYLFIYKSFTSNTEILRLFKKGCFKIFVSPQSWCVHMTFYFPSGEFRMSNLQMDSECLTSYDCCYIFSLSSFCQGHTGKRRALPCSSLKESTPLCLPFSGNSASLWNLLCNHFVWKTLSLCSHSHCWHHNIVVFVPTWQWKLMTISCVFSDLIMVERDSWLINSWLWP